MHFLRRCIKVKPMEITISIPQDLWQNPLYLLYILVITVPYGLFTHWTSLPAIKRHNKKQPSRPDGYRETLNPATILGTLLYRISLQLPIRFLLVIVGISTMVVAMIGGTVWMIGTFFAGEIQVPYKVIWKKMGVLFSWVWKWRMTPEELYRSWSW